MQIKVDERIKQNPEWDAAVERASQLLEAELGSAAGRVTVDWSTSQDERGRPVISLKISDPPESIVGRFVPAELANPDRVQARLQRLWGDLLQVRTSQQLQAVIGGG